MDDDYVDRLNRFEEILADAGVREVLPEDRWHDRWDGAAGCEFREGPYMPYPHHWDRSLNWCQIRTWGLIVDGGGEPGVAPLGPDGVHPDLIAPWVYARAIHIPMSIPIEG